MRIAICDDEQPCIDRLLSLINQYFLRKSVKPELFTFTDPLLLGNSELTSYDIVFLDANMGEVSGIEVAKALREVNRNAVLVYISAFVEYAPMGYGVDAFRYLMKDSLERVFADNMNEIMSRYTQKSEKIFITTLQGCVSVNISTLVFVESFRHQIIFHLSDGTHLESLRYTLVKLSELLKAYHFLRIHKSFLVNPEHILTIKNRLTTLDNGVTLNCSKQGYTEILGVFMLWKGGL